ncbi:MAG: MnmC family methyltransferase [Verrucomicrobiota bacterium]|nr:MnmC family methyltransferase [Verrucomicrobiota bacterium]
MKREEDLRLGDYEVHRAWEGFASVRQISSGEIMHSRTAPMEEARKLYVEQSFLAERLTEHPRKQNPLVLWDVGLGAGANAMAAIECYGKVSGARPLQIISFENDLDSLRLALEGQRDFPYLRVDAATAILADGHWQSPDDAGLSWQLSPGDFLETMERATAPDLIFYDMFSTRSSAHLWTLGLFRKLFAACAGRPVELFTYTCSTANRAALLVAGFHLARGRNAGEKVETTIALTPAALRSSFARRRELLASDWLAKWNRSAAKFPTDVAPNECSGFEKIIRDHEQFRNSSEPERLSSTT